MGSAVRHDETVRWALETFGAQVTVPEIIGPKLGKMSEQTWRDGVRSGKFPQPVRRGRWATEDVVRAILKDEAANDAEPDPFEAGAKALRGPVPRYVS